MDSRLKNMEISLQVLICSYADGVQGLLPEAFPEVEGVGYLVSWQRPDLHGCLGGRVVRAREIDDMDMPALLRRKDFDVYVSATGGLSVNRNIAISKATAPLCLIADDDMSYTAPRLLSVIDAFASRPAMQVAAFSFEGDDKSYPGEEFDLRTPPRGWYVSSVELAFRRTDVRNSGVEFDDEVGLGAPRYGSGEEELWLHYLLQAGLQGRFVPQVIGRHRGLSTGVRKASDPGVLLAQGFVMGSKGTPLAPLRLAVKACRVWRATGRSLCYCLCRLLQGWVEGCLRRHRRRRKGIVAEKAQPSSMQQIQ